MRYASTLRALEPVVGAARVALLHTQLINIARWGDAAGRHTQALFPKRQLPRSGAAAERAQFAPHVMHPLTAGGPAGAHASSRAVAAPERSPYGGSFSPLHVGLRGAAELSLGQSLGHVRVFHGPEAAAFARSQRAAALVWGSDIVLGAGVRNAPGAILAEEVAHVVQQRGATGPRYPQVGAPLSRPGAAVESAARRAAPWVLAGRQARLGSVARRAIMRHEEGGRAPEERNAEDLAPQSGSMRQRSEEELAQIVNDERGVPRYRREGVVYLPERPGAVTLDLWLAARAEQEERKRSPRGKGDPDSGEGYKVGGELFVPVQRKAMRAGGARGAAAQSVAARGTRGPGSGLPFSAQIQRSFGRHDVRGVRAHLGTMAAEASEALNARAYARGDEIAFRSNPDLHTTAHEAAHVVQQRFGVSLDGGLGRDGDVYEQHADAVADAVVSGRSAQGLLDQSPRGGRAGGVQLRSELESSDAGARRQYQQLLSQQEHAHGRGSGSGAQADREQFDSIFATAAEFAGPLRTAIRGIQDQAIPIRGADGDRQQTLVQYMDLLARSSPGLRGRSYADVVYENLSSRGAGAQQRAREHLEGGGDVFKAFEGRWRGTWVGRGVQNGRVQGGGIGSGDRVYDHDWQRTEAAGDAGDNLQVQPVEMGEYASDAPARQPGQGTQSHAPQGAINAVDTDTGRITGGVGIHDGGGANQPCAGYFVDANTLLWVSHENGGQGDLFTVFFEHGTRDEPSKYLIMGVQFRWDGSAVTITQLSGTEYNQVPQQRNGVQRMGRGYCDEDVHDAADRGIQGAGGALPHGERVQAAFGGHDVGGIRAHVGGAAAEASAAMGAEAYATGDAVAFSKAPDLHTAAHEAAHVVQQRKGVSLAGGVGQEGDTYEMHADAVADAVVRGESAEDLLSAGPGGGDSMGLQLRSLETVQRRASPQSRVLQRVVQRQVLHGSERDAATAEGIPPDGIRNRARLLPLSISGASPKAGLVSAAFNLRRELIANSGTRGYFVPADPTHTNTACPGVALVVEAGVLTNPDGLLAVASEIIDAYIRVPGSVGQEPARRRMTVILHGRDRPISLHHDNLGLEASEAGIILKKAGANGARPTYHEFAHAFAGHSPSGSLSEGLASFVQGEYRPNQADRYFPFAQDPHAATLGSNLFQDATLVARIGAAGDAPNFHAVPGQSEQAAAASRARRMWFYRASWSFVHYLVREVQPVQPGGGAQEQSEQQGGGAGRQASASQDPGMQAFMQVYQDPGAYQRVYGQDLATLRTRWRSWILITAGVQARQRAQGAGSETAPVQQRKARSAVVQRMRAGQPAVQLRGKAVQRRSDIQSPHQQTRNDYAVLRGEMENALGRGTNTAQGRRNQQTYDNLFTKAGQFATALRAAIVGIQNQQIPIRGAAGDRRQSLTQYMAIVAQTSTGLAGQNIADIVQRNLADKGRAAQGRAKAHTDAGGDVFASFQGRWRGQWVGRNVTAGRVQGATGITSSDGTYDHDWQQTQGSANATDNIRSQPVAMGAYNPSATPRSAGQGTQTTSSDAAINTVDTSTGRIVGAVGVNRQGRQGQAPTAQRPHAGYFIDANTLLWIAQEGGNLYSCFFEHTTNQRPPRYLIMGVQFRWDGTNVAITQLMGTEYNRPPQQRQGAVQRRSAGQKQVQQRRRGGRRGGGTQKLSVGGQFSVLNQHIDAGNKDADKEIVRIYTDIHGAMTSAARSAVHVAGESIGETQRSLDQLTAVSSGDEKERKRKVISELETFKAEVTEKLVIPLRTYHIRNGGNTKPTFARNASKTLYAEIYQTDYASLILTKELDRIINYKAEIGRFGRGQDQIVEDAAKEVQDLLLSAAALIVQKVIERYGVPGPLAGLLTDLAKGLLKELGNQAILQGQINFEALSDKLWKQFLLDIQNALIGVLTRNVGKIGPDAGVGDKIKSFFKQLGLKVGTQLFGAIEQEMAAGKDIGEVLRGVFTADFVLGQLKAFATGVLLDVVTGRAVKLTPPPPAAAPSPADAPATAPSEPPAPAPAEAPAPSRTEPPASAAPEPGARSTEPDNSGASPQRETGRTGAADTDGGAAAVRSRPDGALTDAPDARGRYKFRDPITRRKVLATPDEWRAYTATKKRYSLTEWRQRQKSGGGVKRSNKLRQALSTPKGQEAHHLIPFTLFKNHPLAQRARHFDWDPDGASNGINLPDTHPLSRRGTDSRGRPTVVSDPAHRRPGHRDHPGYTAKVKRLLDLKMRGLEQKYGSLAKAPKKAVEAEIAAVEKAAESIARKSGSHL